MRYFYLFASFFSELLSACALGTVVVCGLLCLIFALRCMRRAARVCGILAAAALCPLLLLLL